MLFICPNVNTCEKAYGCPHGKPHKQLHGSLYVKPCVLPSGNCPACRNYVKGEVVNRLPSPKEKATTQFKNIDDIIKSTYKEINKTDVVLPSQVRTIVSLLEYLNKEVFELKTR